MYRMSECATQSGDAYLVDSRAHFVLPWLGFRWLLGNKQKVRTAALNQLISGERGTKRGKPTQRRPAVLATHSVCPSPRERTPENG